MKQAEHAWIRVRPGYRHPFYEVEVRCRRCGRLAFYYERLDEIRPIDPMPEGGCDAVLDHPP